MGNAASGRSPVATGRSDVADIASIDASFSRAVQLLDDLVDNDGALEAGDKHLLSLAAAAVRDPSRCVAHAERSVGSGATPEQLHGVALALYLSRGAAPARAVVDAAAAAGAAAPAPVLSPAQADTPALDVDGILAEFAAVFGEIPDRVRLLAEHAPDALEAYHRMRVAVLRDGVLAPRIAELILFCVNAADHRGDYAAVHAQGARRAGASEAALVEAGVAAIAFGGVAAWLAASEAIIATRPPHRTAG